GDLPIVYRRLSMLEKYFVRPETVDRIRRCWIADTVELYVSWLSAQRYSQRTVLRRVPVAVAFGEFARGHGAVNLGQLPDHVESFAQAWAAGRRRKHRPAARKKIADFARNIGQSIFSLASRQEGLRWPRIVIRDGKLKMTWAKPPDEARSMGIESSVTIASVLGHGIFDGRDRWSMSH
ncbi:MAG: hypothetical protein WA741_29670, partial [Candidatus Sulfotelmatobacter sp.]